MDIFKPLEIQVKEYANKHPRRKFHTKAGVRYYCVCGNHGLGEGLVPK